MRMWMVVALAIMVARASAEEGKPATAKTLYEHGNIAYNLLRYTEALDAFRRAYELKQDPALLWNIGQCLRQLGQYDAAARSYRLYRSHASASAVGQIDKLIAQMDEAGKQMRAAMEAPPVAMTTDGRSELAAQPAPRAPLYKRWWLWTAAGVVVAGAAVGIGVGVVSYQQTPKASTGLGTVTW